MYCPICSSKISLAQKYCRYCGFGLEKLVESVSEQLPTKLEENLTERENRLERLGVIALNIFGIGVLGFFLYIFINKVILLWGQGKIFAAIGLAILFLFLACGLVSVFLFAKAKDVQEASNKRGLQHPGEITEALGTSKLLHETRLGEIPSVIECTTELLSTERKVNGKGN